MFVVSAQGCPIGAPANRDGLAPLRAIGCVRAFSPETMMHRFSQMTSLLTLTALAASGCAARDFGDLPKDERDRAMLCMRAGVAGVGMTAQAGQKEAKDRLIGKVRQLSEATSFETLFPKAKTDMEGALGGQQVAAQAVQSNWLSTLNSCLKAYDVALEPTPSLPAAPYEQAVMCAAATALDASRGKAINPNAAVVDDPQGFYFVHKAAHLAGKPTLEPANAAVDAIKPLLDNGAGHLFAEQCRKADPKAATPVSQSLPADPVITGVICTTALSALKGGGLAVGAGDTERGGRYAAGERRVDAALAKLTVDKATVLAAQRPAAAYVAQTGNGIAAADTCLQRYP